MKKTTHLVDAKASPQPPDDVLATPQQLPGLDRFLRTEPIAQLVAQHGHTLVSQTARGMLAEMRQRALDANLLATAITPEALTYDLTQRITLQLAPTMKVVFNLTGTVIHTNLGRSPLAAAALTHINKVMGQAVTLEYDLASGQRGDRDHIVEKLLCELTGAEAATVVNNNAAAVLLMVAALAHGREVVVSRGELVEIGGSFRLPDVMASAGACLVEVGTTNRTHLRDYENAIGADTALLMKVHTSNYAVQGFTATVDEAELAQLARTHEMPLVTDLGSGALIRLETLGLPHEPTPREMLKAGVDAVSFSGDKLLGGPQAGLIVGRRDVIERIRRHPMKRALRVGKLLMTALEATLRLYLQPEHLVSQLPALRLLTRPLPDIQRTAEFVLPELQAALTNRFRIEMVPTHSQIGAGALPVEQLDSVALAITPTDTRDGGGVLNQLHHAFRALPQPVIGRLQDKRLLLDMRCLEDCETFIQQLALLRPSCAGTDKT